MPTKITSFNPIILSPNAEEVVALFEELGFERAHAMDVIEGRVVNYDLKLGEDFRVDVAQSDKVPQDLTAIRMSVRDFNEATTFLSPRDSKTSKVTSSPRPTPPSLPS